MDISGKLDLFKNSLGQLRLAHKDTSSAMRTAVSSPEEKAVDLGLLEQEEKDEFKKSKKKKDDSAKDEIISYKKGEFSIAKTVDTDKKSIEKDPLKLLKLF